MGGGRGAGLAIWIQFAFMAAMLGREFLPLPELVRTLILVAMSLNALYILIFRTTPAERVFSAICIPIILGGTYYTDIHPEFSLTTRRLFAVPIIATLLVWIIGIYGGVDWWMNRRNRGAVPR